MRTHWQMIALCITAICIGVPFTTSGALLHLSTSDAVLFSSLFFVGCGAGTVIGGRFADRFSPLQVMFGSCLGVMVASIAFPLWSETWVLIGRLTLGLWIGSVFVAGARLASLQRAPLLSQGLYGGSVQLGAGLAVLLTPRLLSWFSWQGVLLFWGIGCLVPVAWWFVLADRIAPVPQQRQTTSAWRSEALSTALHAPTIWKLGAVHAGTFGLGTAIAAWITTYLMGRFHLSLTNAATFGSLYLLSGVILRPVGGLLVERAEQRMLQIIQIAVLLTVLGVAVLAFAPDLPLALAGTLLLALGMNMPYASVLTLAARHGQASGIGAASAQGAVVTLLCLSLIGLPILIGMGMATGQPFTMSGLLIGALALLGACTLTWSPQQEMLDAGLPNSCHEQRQYNLLTAHPTPTSRKEDVYVP